MPFDLLLRGGRVVDPSQKLDAVTDVAFAGGRVVAVGRELRADPGTEVRDVSGYTVPNSAASSRAASATPR